MNLMKEVVAKTVNNQFIFNNFKSCFGSGFGLEVKNVQAYFAPGLVWAELWLMIAIASKFHFVRWTRNLEIS